MNTRAVGFIVVVQVPGEPFFIPQRMTSPGENLVKLEPFDTSGRNAVTVFASRKAARSAIARTQAYHMACETESDFTDKSADIQIIALEEPGA